MNKKFDITDFQNDMILYTKGWYNHENLTQLEILFYVVDKHYGLDNISYMTESLILFYHMEAFYEFIPPYNLRQMIENIGNNKYDSNCYGSINSYKLDLSQRLKYYVAGMQVKDDKDVFFDLKVDEDLKEKIRLIGEKETR